MPVMPSTTELPDNGIINPLPPFISSNLREKLDAEQISISGIFFLKGKQKHKKKEVAQTLKQPKPLYRLEIVCEPCVLKFEIEDTKITQRLRIWNVCTRSIYLHCCGLWDESCHFGASWRCYPRTRVLLAPGLTSDIYIRATPRDSSPVPSAIMTLQLAAVYKRDNVVGYFVVPIQVYFLKYIPPSLGE